MEILLSQVRNERGVSQERLAQLLGQSRANVQNIERGRAKSITFATLGALCSVLECQPGDLLRWVPDKSAADVDDHPS